MIKNDEATPEKNIVIENRKFDFRKIVNQVVYQNRKANEEKIGNIVENQNFDHSIEDFSLIQIKIDRLHE